VARPDPGQFFTLAVVAGAGLGAVQAASRALLAGWCRRAWKRGCSASTRCAGRAPAILGPLVFGGVSYLAGGDQRLGILAIGACS